MKVHPELAKSWGPEWDHPEVQEVLRDLSLHHLCFGYGQFLSCCGGRVIRWYNAAQVRHLAKAQGFVSCSYCTEPIRQGRRYVALYAPQDTIVGRRTCPEFRLLHPWCAPLADTLTEQWG